MGRSEKVNWKFQKSKKYLIITQIYSVIFRFKLQKLNCSRDLSNRRRRRCDLHRPKKKTTRSIIFSLQKQRAFYKKCEFIESFFYFRSTLNFLSYSDSTCSF